MYKGRLDDLRRGERGSLIQKRSSNAENVVKLDTMRRHVLTQGQALSFLTRAPKRRSTRVNQDSPAELEPSTEQNVQLSVNPLLEIIKREGTGYEGSPDDFQDL